MTNEITVAKAEFKLDLAEAGLNVQDYVPERIVPPIVIINSASPYLTPSDLSNEYILSLEVVMVAQTATNAQATEKLDELIESLVNAMPRYARLLRVNAPYNLQTNNTEYLAANASVELEITI